MACYPVRFACYPALILEAVSTGLVVRHFFLDKKVPKKSRLTLRGLKILRSAARKELAALKQLSASPASFHIFLTPPPLRPILSTARLRHRLLPGCLLRKSASPLPTRKGDANGEQKKRRKDERNSAAHSRVERRCRRRAAKEDPTSSERALRNPCTKAIKTEICLSEASSFPFSLGAGVLARAGAVLIFASFHLRKRRNIV